MDAGWLACSAGLLRKLRLPTSEMLPAGDSVICSGWWIVLYWHAVYLAACNISHTMHKLHQIDQLPLDYSLLGCV